MNEKKTCKRCGICCRNSGPALHQEDKGILRAGHIFLPNLVTIRQGEWAVLPHTEELLASEREMVKVGGKGSEWTCCFFENSEPSGCAIYANRPLECRLLFCTDPSDLLPVIGKDTVTRLEIIDPADPLIEFIEQHECDCAYTRVQALAGAVLHAPDAMDSSSALHELTEVVRRDIALRMQAGNKLGLPFAMELFVFGRPIFMVLAALGIAAHESEGQLHLRKI